MFLARRWTFILNTLFFCDAEPECFVNDVAHRVSLTSCAVVRKHWQNWAKIDVDKAGKRRREHGHGKTKAQPEPLNVSFKMSASVAHMTTEVFTAVVSA